MFKLVRLFVVLGVLISDPVVSKTVSILDDVRAILETATKVGHGNIISSIYVQSGYPQLPKYVWREKYEELNGFEREDYYATVRDGEKGKFIARTITYLTQGDVSYVLWVDRRNTLLWFQKKIPKKTILALPERKIKLQFTAFIDYDRYGHITNVHQDITHVDDVAKAEFVRFELSSDGEIRDLKQGDFDYYQLTD